MIGSQRFSANLWLHAEAMAATIEGNLREMMEINGNARGLVHRVSKQSIATVEANGSGQADADIAAKGSGAIGHNGNGGRSGSTNGVGNGSSWVNRLKQFAGVVEQEI